MPPSKRDASAKARRANQRAVADALLHGVLPADHSAAAHADAMPVAAVPAAPAAASSVAWKVVPSDVNKLCLNIEQHASGHLPFNEALLATFVRMMGPPIAFDDQLDTIMDLLARAHFDDHHESRIDGLRGVRRLTCAEKNPPIQEVINSGVLPRVIAALHADDPYQQFEAAWVLTNIASGTHVHARMITAALPRLVDMMDSRHTDLQEQSIWAIGNYAGSNPQMRDETLALGVMPKLLKLMGPKQPVCVLRVAVWCVSNLVRGKPVVDFQLVRGVFAALAGVLASSADEAVWIDACWALSFLTDDNSLTNERLNEVIGVSGLVRRMVSAVAHPTATVQSASLRCIGNIASGNDVHTQALLDADVLPALQQLLANPKKTLKKEACWVLSNISAGKSSHITEIIEAGGFIPTLIQILDEETWMIQKEAAWCISNITTNGLPHLLLLLTRPPLLVVPPLLRLVKLAEASDDVNHVCATAILNLIRVAALDQAKQGQMDSHHSSVDGGQAAHAPSPAWRNPILAQLESVDGGVRMIVEFRDHHPSDSPLHRCAVEILKELHIVAPTETDATNQQNDTGKTTTTEAQEMKA